MNTEEIRKVNVGTILQDCRDNILLVIGKVHGWYANDYNALVYAVDIDDYTFQKVIDLSNISMDILEEENMNKSEFAKRQLLGLRTGPVIDWNDYMVDTNNLHEDNCLVSDSKAEKYIIRKENNKVYKYSILDNNRTYNKKEVVNLDSYIFGYLVSCDECARRYKV